MAIPMGDQVMAVPAPPRRRPNTAREIFQAFARADTRAELEAAMRAQAAAYFEGPVTLLELPAQPGPNGQKAYQGSSKWAARPETPAV